MTLNLDNKPILNINQGILEFSNNKPYILSNPEVIAALYESACSLGILTRLPNARITCGNMYE